MRHATIARRVKRPSVTHLLHDEMAFGLVSQVGNLAKFVEINPITVQVGALQVAVQCGEQQVR